MKDKDWITSGEWEKVFSVDFQIGDEIRGVWHYGNSGWDYKVIGFDGSRVMVQNMVGRVLYYSVPEAWGDNKKSNHSMWYRRVTTKPYDPSQQKDEEDDI